MNLINDDKTVLLDGTKDDVNHALQLLKMNLVDIDSLKGNI